MKKLLIIILAILFVSCEKESIIEQPQGQDHWKVRYLLDCDGELDQFIHVSNEEFVKGKKTMYAVNETCVMFKFKDMSGKVGYYIMPSASRPCKEH